MRPREFIAGPCICGGHSRISLTTQDVVRRQTTDEFWTPASASAAINPSSCKRPALAAALRCTRQHGDFGACADIVIYPGCVLLCKATTPRTPCPLNARSRNMQTWSRYRASFNTLRDIAQKRTNHMPNIAAILKQEITRLARKETRSLTKSSYRAIAQFRRDIAELKRRNSKAEAAIARLERLIGEAGAPKPAKAGIGKVRFTVRSVRSQRKRLGISAADYGKLIGVTGHTVYKWEHGASKPRTAQLAALSALRGLGKREAKQRLEQLDGMAPKGRKRTR